MADKYLLKVTAGPSYDEQSQVSISPNTEIPHLISSPALDALVTVRVQNYRGLPKSAPKTSPYFSHPPHIHDLYSLQFSIVPKTDLNAHDIVLGNDFDHPIRDKLPPGFDQAFKIVKWFIDPGLEGDVYADEPGLFGPLLSSINVFNVGGKGADLRAEAEKIKSARDGKTPKVPTSKADDDDDEDDDDEMVPIIIEGASHEDGSDAASVRDAAKIPADAAARKKFFLTPAHLKDFTFQAGRKYEFDFFNPYLDFNEFALKLPGFSVIPGITIPVISYWDGQPLRSHAIRYVLKNRVTNEPLFVVIFTLLPRDQVEEGNTTASPAQLVDETSARTAAATADSANDDLD